MYFDVHTSFSCVHLYFLCLLEGKINTFDVHMVYFDLHTSFSCVVCVNIYIYTLDIREEKKSNVHMVFFFCAQHFHPRGAKIIVPHSRKRCFLKL